MNALIGTAPAPQAPARVYVDATFGRGGHSRALLARMREADRLLAFDRDPEAIAVAQAIGDSRLAIHHGPFSELMLGLRQNNLGLSIDGLLMDLGVSSPQIDDPARGFSFRHDGPLDMRMDPTRGEPVSQWLARATPAQIAEVIRDLGEERFASAIARAIVARREQGAMPVRTGELAALVASVVRTREAGQDPATRTFQALRIHINRELDELRETLALGLERLRTGGRLVVIAFHSLEDRIVKQFIASQARPVYDRRVPFAPVPEPCLIAIDRIKPGDDEVARNPRARSAVMRVAQRTAAPAGQRGGKA